MTRGQVALSDRQMKIIEYIHADGSVKSGDLVRLYGISRQAAGKGLTRMVERNLIKTKGKDMPLQCVIV